jgi:hypothetical protein
MLLVDMIPGSVPADDRPRMLGRIHNMLTSNPNKWAQILCMHLGLGAYANREYSIGEIAKHFKMRRVDVEEKINVESKARVEQFVMIDGLSETSESIGRWGIETFGKGDPTRPNLYLRVLEEAVELCHAAGVGRFDVEDFVSIALDKASTKPVGLEHVPGELADVKITVDIAGANLQLVMDHEVNNKMRINRDRKWNRRGDGTAQHIPSGDQPARVACKDPADAPAETPTPPPVPSAPVRSDGPVAASVPAPEAVEVPWDHLDPRIPREVPHGNGQQHQGEGLGAGAVPGMATAGVQSDDTPPWEGPDAIC